MTNGSSQGLFVVVAVVIFGIFVAIAYTLFEDNLRPALASMFSDATEQVINNMLYDGLVPTDEAFFEIDKETGTITKYTGIDKDVVIPQTIRGTTVRIIGEYAFDRLKLTSLYMPDTVTKLEYYSISNNNITKLRLSSNLKEIGSSSLAYNSLKELELPNSLEVIGNGALRGVGTFDTLVIPKSVREMRTLNLTFLKVNNVKMTEKLWESSKDQPDFLLSKYAWDSVVSGQMINQEYYSDSIIEFY